MNIPKFNSDQLKRIVNLVFQTVMVTILFLYEVNEAIPLKLIIWQIIHFALIAIYDYYLDDYLHKKRIILSLLLISYLIFLSISLYYGIFDELYIRIHISILILGNLLGKKIDTPFWKWLTLLNIVIISIVEILKNELSAVLGISALYALGAIFLLAMTERLSEINKNFWILHTIILTVWITFKGCFYEEAFIFLIGCVSYEAFKIALNNLPKAAIDKKW